MNLGDALAGLDPLEQKAVALIYFDGRTYADAAQILGVERATVAAAVARAFRVVSRWALPAAGDSSTSPSTSGAVGLRYDRAPDPDATPAVAFVERVPTQIAS